VIVTGTPPGKNVYEEVDGKRKVARSILSAERMAESLMTGLGHTIETPDMTSKTAQYLGGGSSLQLDWILTGQWELYRTKNGALNHRFITERPDIIVAVGKPDASRAKAALDTWKKLYAWRPDGTDQFFVPFHSVAVPPKKTKKKEYKATKKNERDLVTA
jgi:hypothetical protein